MKILKEKKFEGLDATIQLYHGKGGYQLRISTGETTWQTLNHGPYTLLKDAEDVFDQSTTTIEEMLKDPQHAEAAKAVWNHLKNKS